MGPQQCGYTNYFRLAPEKSRPFQSSTTSFLQHALCVGYSRVTRLELDASALHRIRRAIFRALNATWTLTTDEGVRG
jgi:hypothetical protein